MSGALHGLFRVRCFTQDDAHIFMTPDQMKDEIKNVVKLFDEVYSTFGLTYQIELSTMPEDHMGDEKDWKFAEDTLQAAITEMGKDFVINAGDGAFYGPKLDFHLADSLGRTWQCGTIQLDFQMPERFELEYVGEDGEKHRPVMIHRALLGSIERFIGVITEHFAGAFPAWLSPVQVKLLPVTDRAMDYAEDVAAQLDEPGLPGGGGRPQRKDRQEDPGGHPGEDPLSCWWWATGIWRRAPCPSAPAPARTWGPCPWRTSPPSSTRSWTPRQDSKKRTLFLRRPGLPGRRSRCLQGGNRSGKFADFVI